MKYICIVLFFIPISTYCQFKLSGTVSDLTGKPYIDMEVRIEQMAISRFTDSKGFFEFIEIPIGEYAVSFDYEFDKEYRKVVIFNRDEVYNIELARRINFDEVTIVNSKLQSFASPGTTTINADQIESAQTEKDVPYLLEKLSSVQIQSDAGNGVGYTDIRIRGIDPQHIQFNLNGIPLNDAESSRTYLVDIPDILSNTEKIFVHTGYVPGRSGPGAFGASVDMFTNKLFFKPFAKIKLGIADFNTTSYVLQANSGLFEDAYNIEVKISGLKSNGFIERSSSNLKSFSLSLVKIKPTYNLRFNILNGKETTGQAWNGLPFSYFPIDSLYRYNSAGTEKEDQAYDNEIDHYSQTHFQTFYNHTFSDYTFNFTGNYTRGIGYYENYKADNLLADYKLSNKDTLISDLIRQKWLNNHFIYTYAGLERSWKFGLQGSLGIGYSKYLGDHFGEVIWTKLTNVEGLDKLYYENQGVKDEFSTMIKFNQKWNPKLNTTLDLQARMVSYKIMGSDDVYGDVNLRQNSFLISPKFLINYAVNDKLVIELANSYYQREPYREDILNNPLVKDEQLYSLDFSSSYRLNNLTLGLRLYQMNYYNYLSISGKLSDTGDPLRVNIPQAVRQGVEISSEINFLDRVNLYWNFNLLRNSALDYIKNVPVYDGDDLLYYDSTRFDNIDLAFSPHMIHSFGLIAYLLGKEEKNFSITAQWHSKWVGAQFLDISENPEAKLPSYLSSNAKLQLHKKLKNISIESYLQINNVLNQRYSSHGWFSSFKQIGLVEPSSDPYLGAGSNGFQYYKGLYPQALRYLSFGLDLVF
ncbi:MAG: TonB-dependent receptor [Saprospiraceae bacterium]